jgi:AcrR family transcriptional regulator
MGQKPMGQRNPDRSRRRLLTAAIRLFAARGFHGVSVDQIVATARINKRMVYHYFGSKEAIYEAALHEVYGRIEDVEFHALGSGVSPREKLTRLLKSYFAFLDANPEFTQFLLWENVEKGRHIAKGDHPLSKNPFIQRFRQTVEEGIAGGELRPDLDVSHLLIHFIGLCFIYHSNRFSLSQSLEMDLGDPAVRARGLQQVLSLVFEGITLPPRANRRAEPVTADHTG